MIAVSWDIFAEDELCAAIDYYNSVSHGLGFELLLCVDAMMESISRNPELGSTVYKGVKRRLIKRFPYGIYFKVIDDEVLVIGFRHFKQKPVRR